MPAPKRVPALAKHFAAQIRSIQPNGPYSLIGNCMGGVLAYEVMLQLKQAGQDVDRVILIDCAAPKLQSIESARGLAHDWRRFVQLMQSGRLVKAVQGRITRRLIKPVQRQFNLDLDIRRAIKYLWDAKTFYRAASRHNGPLLVILNSLSRETERSTRWSDVAPKADVHFVEDTDHLDLFQSDRALDQVGQLINHHLENNDAA
jgi:thioesterase domain-containing protein